MVRILHFERSEFLASGRWKLSPGQHTTILGPSGWGKTTLAYQLIERAANPKFPAFILVPKPRDETSEQWGKKLGFKRTPIWPPDPLTQMSWGNPPGYLVWPKHTFDDAVDNYHLWEVFRRTIMMRYRKGKSLIFADDVEEMCEELKLEPALKTILRMGRAMKTSAMLASQRPADVPRLAYSGAIHLFLGNNPDEYDRKRYRDIGGLARGYPTKTIEEATLELPEFHWLYIRRRPFAICTIGP